MQQDVQQIEKGRDCPLIKGLWSRDFVVYNISNSGGHWTSQSEEYLVACRYTGEDGFEISVPNEDALALAKQILEKSGGKIRLTGLGARDSLRLEAGLCLYGNDLEQDISPIEAGLAWTVAKRRRADGGFLGAETILQQLKDGPSRRRVGLISTGAPARAHSEMLDSEGKNIGEVTSGGFSPCLKKNIAMGYVQSGHHKNNTKVKVTVRSKTYDAVVTKMPFVPAKYHKPPQPVAS